MSRKKKEKNVSNVRFSLSFKLLLFTGVLILTLTIGNLISATLTSYDGILDVVEKDLTSLAIVAEQGISDNIANLRKTFLNIRNRNIAILSGQELEEIAESNGWIYLAVADEKGKIIKGPKEYLGSSIEGNEYFDKAKKEGYAITSPFIDINDNFIINLYATSQNNILVAAIDGTYLSNLIENFRVGDSGNVFILDQDGTMIANMRPQLVEERQNFIKFAETDKAYKSAGELYSIMITGVEGIGNYTYAGVDRICYYKPLSANDGWYTAAVAPIEEMTFSISYVFRNMIITSLILLALGIVVSIIFAKRIANPLIQISNRMKLLEQGDLSSDVPVFELKDEVGELSKSIDGSIKTLSTYVEDITKNMGEIAKGNFTSKPSIEYAGDFKLIEEDLNTTVEGLSGTMSNILEASNIVNNGSSQLASAATDLATGSTEQASSIEELTSSIANIAEQANENLENVKVATEFINEVNIDINISDDYMNKLNHAMEDIRVSSTQIVNITKIIDDIAFQTNILALNAAVEAARAGEAGRGFAVVADEVRMLALRSADAAQETANLIENAVNRIEDGSQTATDAGAVLNKVREKANNLNEIISSIEVSTSEQASAIEQTKVGVSQVATVVETNAATAEENSAISEEMSSQAGVLYDEVSKFNLI